MQLKETKKDLRKFGLTLGIAFGLLAGLFFWRGKGFYVYPAGVSIFFLFFGLALPGLLKPVQRIWMRLAVAMSFVMTRVILTVFYFTGVTLIAFLARLCGKHFLDDNFKQKKDTYWIKRGPAPDSKSYENQF